MLLLYWLIHMESPVLIRLAQLEDKMNEVLKFPVERIFRTAKDRKTQTQCEHMDKDHSAEILFFSGVRYSPMADDAKPVRLGKHTRA